MKIIEMQTLLKEWFGEKIDLSKTEKSNSAPQT